MGKKEMTTEVAEKLYNENAKKLKIKFNSYYKYCFSYSGEVGDVYISLSYGGCTDDIYRYSVDCEEFSPPITFKELKELYSIHIKNKKTGEEFIHIDE